MKEKCSIKQVIDACADSFGICEVARKKCGLGRTAFYNYRKRHPRIQEALDDAREIALDVAELRLMGLVRDGDFQAIRFFLERKGADRGWGDSRKLDVTSGGAQLPPVVIKFADDE